MRRIVLIPLALRVGWFILTASRRLAADDLRSFVRRLRSQRAGRASFERVIRVRDWWLRKRFFGAYDTCYVRAFTLYRFMEAADADLGIHFGVEPPRESGHRLHGHAWVSLNGSVLEGPGGGILERTREIFASGSIA